MKAIYESKGKAREYSELACNPYSGCDHGCIYCYVPMIVKRKREDFHSTVYPREGILEQVKRDAVRLSKQGEKRSILFSFTCDPYCTVEAKHRTTRDSVNIIHENGLNVTILTKGGNRIMNDFLSGVYSPKDHIATTLTVLDYVNSLKWEPLAAPPAERLQMLRFFKEEGYPTWVSLEPVLDPEVSLKCIEVSHWFVDEYKIGKLNYDPKREKEIDWKSFAERAIELCEKNNTRYYIKDDLRKYLSEKV